MTTIEVKSGVVSRGVEIGQDNELLVDRGGVAVGSLISGYNGLGHTPAAMVISGIARTTVFSAGGVGGVRVGGVAYDTTVDQDSLFSVLEGGEAVRTILNAGHLGITSGGHTSGTIVSSGGLEGVGTGGSTTGTILLSSGGQGIDGGVAHRTVVSSGGDQYVDDGTTAGTTISSGGTETLQGGLSIATRILAGGEELVSSATASGSLISSGAREIVWSGGVADGTQVYRGGVLTVSATGRIAGGLTIHAGLANIAGPATAGQTVRFAGVGGTLELDQFSTFHAAISGLHGAYERIELGGLAFLESETVSWKQLGTSGTLTVKGDEIARLTLIGQYTASDFKLANDFHDGTYVTYQSSTTAAAPARLAQAMAGFSGRDGALAVHSGGAAVMSQPLIAAVSSGR